MSDYPFPPLPDGDDGAEDQARGLARLRDCLYTDDSLAGIPAPEPLIEHWLAMNTLAWLFGEKGHAKSFVAQDMAGCVANGVPWHGHAVKQVPVLYAVLEGASGAYGRARAWAAFNGLPGTGINFLVPRPQLQILPHAAPFADLAVELGAGMVIIDTQNRATVGLDENSNVDMGRMIAALDHIREATGACILTVHHSGIGSNRPRGHSSIDAAASTMIRVARDGRLVKVANDKQRESEATPSLLLALVNHDLGVVLTPAGGRGDTPTESGAKIVAHLRDLEGSKDRVTHGDLKRACTSSGMSESTFNWSLKKLIEASRVSRVGGSYSVIYPGQAQDTLL